MVYISVIVADICANITCCNIYFYFKTITSRQIEICGMSMLVFLSSNFFDGDPLRIFTFTCRIFTGFAVITGIANMFAFTAGSFRGCGNAEAGLFASSFYRSIRLHCISWRNFLNGRIYVFSFGTNSNNKRRLAYGICNTVK